MIHKRSTALKNLFRGAIYYSPNSNKLLTLIQEAVNLKCDYTLILGDFNFPTFDWENRSFPHSVNHTEFKFTECLRDNVLSQLIDCPTRYRERQTSNILDLVLVDESETA